MTQIFRRVVTANNGAGKSYVQSDTGVAEAELGNFNFWRTAPGGAEPDIAAPVPFFPLMHTTPTTDYIVLLSGEVSLLLDEGEPVPLRPFDAVVQRGTNHTWVVTGCEPAVLMAVMLGTK
jgi:hypothetical protein